MHVWYKYMEVFPAYQSAHLCRLCRVFKVSQLGSTSGFITSWCCGSRCCEPHWPDCFFTSSQEILRATSYLWLWVHAVETLCEVIHVSKLRKYSGPFALPRSCLPERAVQLWLSSSVVLESVGKAEQPCHRWSPVGWGSVHPAVHCACLQRATQDHPVLTEPLLSVH